MPPEVEQRPVATGDRTLKFSVFETAGPPVYKFPQESPPQSQAELTDEFRVYEKEGLQPGDAILAPTLFGWAEATVQKDTFGKLFAENEASGFVLEFTSRVATKPCWVSSSSWNKRGLERLKIKR